ncbi:MAG: alpha/beta hydrolase [Phaeodactylibacter sp.]|nr:alpha/beta hydrolase [Phaeodactylibacter sp.]
MIHLFQEALDLTQHIRRVATATTPGLELKPLKYGDQDSQYLLHCTHPDMPARKDLPVLVYFHGGGWQFGRPDHFRVNAMRLMARGYQVFLASHRKLPFHSYRAMQEDLLFMRRYLDEWMRAQQWVDRRYLLGGVSSGGHLSLQFALDPVVQTQPAQIAGIFALAAPIELDQMPSTPTMWWLGGMRGSALYTAANPISHLLPVHDFPVLVVHGARDGIVPVANAQAFAKYAEQKSRLKVRVEVLPDNNHMDVAAWPFPPNKIHLHLFDWLEQI